MMPPKNSQRPATFKGQSKTIKRLFSYIQKGYKISFIIVLICILISTGAAVASSLFLEILIDDYITPLLAVENPVFTGLLQAILIMTGIFLLGVFGYSNLYPFNGGDDPGYLKRNP